MPVSDQYQTDHCRTEVLWLDELVRNLVSVLAVPFHSEFKTLKNIAFAADMNKWHPLNLYLSDVKRYAEVFDANTHFLDVPPGRKTQLPRDSDAFKEMVN